MTSISRNARIAGLIYVLLGLVAPVRLMYIPGKLFVSGDAVATADNIAAHEMLFRLGIVADLLAALLTLFVGLALYRFLKDVDRNLAVLMLVLGALMVTPIYFVNTLTDAAALMFASGADFLAVFDEAQRDAMALLFLRLHHHGVLVNEIFWGLWLFPFGLLLYRSGWVPRILAVLLFINGVAYLALSLTGLLWPDYENRLSDMLFPALMGEVIAMLWLLIMGAKERGGSAGARAGASPV